MSDAVLPRQRVRDTGNRLEQIDGCAKEYSISMHLHPSRTARFHSLLRFCLMLILCQFSTTHAEAKDPARPKATFGTIEAFTGDVRINGSPVHSGMRVYHGDNLSTGAGKARIVNPSSDFTVGPFSQMVLGFPLTATGMDAYIEMGRGTLRSVIDKVLSPSFEIRTPTTVLGIRGTDFLVHATQKASVAFTREGAISFRADGKTVLVNKMEMTQGGEKIEPITPEKIIASTALTDLLKEVEQFCDMEIPPSLSARKDLNNIIARWNLNYATYLIDKKAFIKAKRLCTLAFFIADLRTLKAEAMLNNGMISFTFMGDEATALTELEEILEHYGDTPFAEQALYFKGLVYYHQNAVDMARKTLETYMKKYPDGKFRENALSILDRLSGN